MVKFLPLTAHGGDTIAVITATPHCQLPDSDWCLFACQSQWLRCRHTFRLINMSLCSCKLYYEVAGMIQMCEQHLRVNVLLESSTWPMKNKVNSSYSWQLESKKPLWALNSQTQNHCSYWKYRVRFLKASGHDIFINQFIYNPVLCVFVFKEILFERHCWFVHSGITTNCPITWAQVKLILYFLRKAHCSLFVLWDAASTAALSSEAIQNSKITKQKAQKCENCGTRETMTKDPC